MQCFLRNKNITVSSLSASPTFRLTNMSSLRSSRYNVFTVHFSHPPHRRCSYVYYYCCAFATDSQPYRSHLHRRKHAKWQPNGWVRAISLYELSPVPISLRPLRVSIFRPARTAHTHTHAAREGAFRQAVWCVSNHREQISERFLSPATRGRPTFRMKLTHHSCVNVRVCVALFFHCSKDAKPTFPFFFSLRCGPHRSSTFSWTLCRICRLCRFEYVYFYSLWNARVSLSIQMFAANHSDTCSGGEFSCSTHPLSLTHSLSHTSERTNKLPKEMSTRYHCLERRGNIFANVWTRFLSHYRDKNDEQNVVDGE